MFAVIMAGGSGTRFWPASRSAKPKQLLDLSGEQTMIQSTVQRLGDVFPADQIMVVTAQHLVEAIQQQLPGLPPSAVIGEPCKRDTAPCVGLAAALIQRQDPNGTMVVMPADHIIQDHQAFQQAMQFADSLLSDTPGRLITFGIKPSYPAESFGYVERAEALDQDQGKFHAYRVKQFREKPKAEVARQYLESGNFYWNSGIFVWKAQTIMNELAVREPDMHDRLVKIAAAAGSPEFQSVFEREFSAIKGKSIDYAVMEHATDVVTIEAPFDWDDVGSWQAMARIRGTNADGNTIAAKRYLGINTKGSIIRSTDEHLVVTIGLEDVLVVHTSDATLVAKKSDEEAVREVVSQLQEKKWNAYL